MLIEANRLLLSRDVRFRIVVLQRTTIELSNGLSICNPIDRATFLRRIKSIMFAPILDTIYDPSISEAQKSEAIRKLKSLQGKNATMLADKTNFLAYVTTKGRPSRFKGKKRPECPSWSKGLTKDTDDRVKRRSDRMQGNLNPSVKHYDTIFTPEYRANHSKRIKDLIAKGSFTPNIMNSMTHRSFECCGKKFRSTWEAVFYYFNRSLLYETLRIPYFDSVKQTDRTYIPDFFDPINNIVYEIKPESFVDTKFADKNKAAEKWCSEHEYKLVLLHKDDILELMKNLTTSDMENFNKPVCDLIERYLNNENAAKD